MTTDKNETAVTAIDVIKTKAVAAAKKRAKAKAAKAKKAAAPKPRAESKQARFIAAMRRPQGISIDEAAKMFDWQKHTVRGAVAGALKRKLKLKVDATQDEKRGTVYRLKK